MCSVDAPAPVEIEKPTFVRNPFLDDDTSDVRSADALRRGRSSLVIPTNASFGGRGGSVAITQTGSPQGNSQPGGIGGGGGTGLATGGPKPITTGGGGGKNGLNVKRV